MPAPDATWAKARLAVSGPALFLPATAGGLVANLLGMPITVAPEIDGALPVLGAVVDAAEETVQAVAPGGAARPRGAMGVHVKSGDRLIDQLTRGDGARFQARVDSATSITLLEPKGVHAAPEGKAGEEGVPAGGAGQGRAAVGVLGNYLLVGAEVADLLVVGPYIARTMSKSAVPKEDLAIEVPRGAIAGPILKAVRGGWERVQGVVGKADALPFAPTIDGWLAVLGDVERARITLSIDEAVHLRLEGTPQQGGGAAARAMAEMAVGDVRPLLELPADALVGLLVRERSASRRGEVDRQVDALARLAGEEIPAKEREPIAEALRAVSDARGDWFTAGLRFDSNGPTAYARMAVKDQGKLSDALEDLVKLTKLPSVKHLLSNARLEASAGKTAVERLPGDVHRLRFHRVNEDKDRHSGKRGEEDKQGGSGTLRDETASTARKTIDLLYVLEGGSLFAAAGYDPQEGLRRAVAAPGREDLAGVPALKAAVGALGGDTAFALIVDPLRLVASRAGKPGAGEAAPVLIAGGATPAALWLRADVAVPAIRELVRYRGAL